MKISKKQAGLKRFVLIVLCLLSILFVLLKQSDYRYLIDGNFSGLSFFFELYSGRDFIVFEFILLLSIPIITHLNTCIYRNNHFDTMIISRIGYREFFFENFKQSIKDVWYYPIVINLLTVFIIHFVLAPIIGKEIDYVANYFTSLGLLDLLLFTFFQMIGWSLLNYFCFLLSQIISNKYAYVLSFGIYTIVTTIAFTIIGSIIPLEIGWLFYIFSPFTLLCPGVIGLWSINRGIMTIIVVVLSFLFHICLLIVLSKYVVKGRVTNG